MNRKPSVRFANPDGSDPDTQDPNDEEDEGEEAGDSPEGTEDEEGSEPQAKMSLMALLAETDRQMGLDGSAYMMDDDEEDEEEDEDEDDEEERPGDFSTCCVCQVRHKGMPVNTCGHTFCRLCSKEVFVQKGTCPVCNGFILEILQVF